MVDAEKYSTKIIERYEKKMTEGLVINALFLKHLLETAFFAGIDNGITKLSEAMKEEREK